MIKQVCELPDEEYLLPGTRVCSGCTLALSFRLALKALGPDTIVTIPAGCSTILQGLYPITSSKVTILNTAFETTASSATGIVAALRALKKGSETTVVGWAGDGGTVDIGLQALSGAAERNEDFIYVCYDNEAYMNTGTQRSSSTPYSALTTTTPVRGKSEHKKDMARIMAAHDIPFIATCTPAYPVDLYNKFLKAKSISGTRYIHIFTPCAPGWGFSQAEGIKLAKLAVQTGVFDLLEIENGTPAYNGITKKIYDGTVQRKPVKEYLSCQKRFRQLSEVQINEIQTFIDKKY